MARLSYNKLPGLYTHPVGSFHIAYAVQTTGFFYWRRERLVWVVLEICEGQYGGANDTFQYYDVDSVHYTLKAAINAKERLNARYV